jgi:hypothetical protein
MVGESPDEVGQDAPPKMLRDGGLRVFPQDAEGFGQAILERLAHLVRQEHRACVEERYGLLRPTRAALAQSTAAAAQALSLGEPQRSRPLGPSTLALDDGERRLAPSTGFLSHVSAYAGAGETFAAIHASAARAEVRVLPATAPCEMDVEMMPTAPTSIVALLAASFIGLSLVILGARDGRRERAALILALGLAGFGAAGIVDVLFALGHYPIGALAVAAALMAGAGAMLARSGG